MKAKPVLEKSRKVSRSGILALTVLALISASCSSEPTDLDAFELPHSETAFQALQSFAHQTIPEDDWHNLCRAPRAEIEAKITLIGYDKDWKQSTLDAVRTQETNRLYETQKKYAPKPIMQVTQLKTDEARGKAIRDLEAYDQFWAGGLFRYPEFSESIPEKNKQVFGLLFNRAQCEEQAYVLAALKPILKISDFPTDDRFGKGTMKSLFLITQHSDADVAFQAEMLDIFKANPNALRASSLALLIDRVKVNQGQAQIYGSQLECVDGAYRPKPVKDLESLNERRESVGLGSIENYTASTPGCGNPF